MRKLIWISLITVLLPFSLNTSLAGNYHGDRQHFCSATAYTVYRACGFDVKDDFWSAKANCINVGDDEERHECFDEARSETRDAVEECGEQLDARLALCNDTSEERYDPDFDPENFVDPREIGFGVTPNPYFPLIAGNQWVYGGDGETITVTVTEKTKLIEGVTCVVVNDVVKEDGVVVEDTDDWHAQDLDGNVWYCGEISKEFELFEGDDPAEPELVEIEGSFKAGREGAKAGILIKAVPAVGDILRQEFALQEAEDVAKVLSVTASAESPAASCVGNCLQTEEYSPLEPGNFEHKYYAPGIGLILEVGMEGDRVELVEFISP